MSDITTQGGRKAVKTREASWQVIIVLVIYAALLWQKVEMPNEALVMFLGAIAGNLGIFTFGNVREHQAKGKQENGQQ